jgi:hypothetical protein
MVIVAGTRICEIIAKDLNQKLRFERPVWRRQIANRCNRFQPKAKFETQRPNNL